MNTLIDKNISQSQLSDPPRIHINEQSNNSSLLYRFTRWLHLIKRWNHESIPEVCMHHT
jgi:hypothetical protein